MNALAIRFLSFLGLILCLSTSVYAQERAVSFDTSGTLMVFNLEHQNTLSVVLIDSGYAECRLFLLQDSSYIVELINANENNIVRKRTQMNKEAVDSIRLLISSRIAERNPSLALIPVKNWIAIFGHGN